MSRFEEEPKHTEEDPFVTKGTLEWSLSNRLNYLYFTRDPSNNLILDRSSISNASLLEILKYDRPDIEEQARAFYKVTQITDPQQRLLAERKISLILAEWDRNPPKKPKLVKKS